MQDFNALYDLIEAEEVSLFDMSVGDVCQCISSEQAFADWIDNHNDWLISRKIAFAKGFIKASEVTFGYFKKFESDGDATFNRAAAEVGGDITMAESIILDCVEFYHLHSTKEAEVLPFSDWFMMKRREVINNAVERRYNKYLMKEQEVKSRK